MDYSGITDALRAAVPTVTGIGFASDDKATWRIDFAPGATDADRTAAAAWVTAFNSATFASVPTNVTNYQARAALINAGLFTQVDNAVQALGKASIEYQAWEYANTVFRNSPFITSMGAQLGLTSAQIDALFVAAAQIS